MVSPCRIKLRNLVARDFCTLREKMRDVRYGRAYLYPRLSPNSLNKRLIQGEWVPISSATRLRGMAPKTSCNAFAVVRTRCSRCIRPASSSTQYHELRSPRSSPMVSSCRELFLPCFATTVLTFFVAGVLYLLRFEHVDR